MLGQIEISELGLFEDTLLNFICHVEDNYHENPFHNFRHALTVTHMTCMLSDSLNAREYLSIIGDVVKISTSAFLHNLLSDALQLN